MEIVFSKERGMYLERREGMVYIAWTPPSTFHRGASWGTMRDGSEGGRSAHGASKLHMLLKEEG